MFKDFGNQHGGGMMGHHGSGPAGQGHHGHGGLGYYAVIEHGLSWSGEIPGVSFTRETFCNSYEELIRKLTKNLEDAMWKRPPMMSYEEVASQNHGKEIVQIFPRER